MDLLGRKMAMKKGRATRLYLAEVRKAIQEAEADPELMLLGHALEAALLKLEKVTAHLLGIAAEGKQDLFLADSTLFLEFFGIVAIGWQWLLQGLVARKALEDEPLEGDISFYQGKVHACRYFFGYELPKIEGLVDRLMRGDGLTVTMNNEYFDD